MVKVGEVRVQVSGQEVNHEEMRYEKSDGLKIEVEVRELSPLGGLMSVRVSELV